jgi:hypothetical protein
MRLASEHPQRHFKGWVELVQVPAQPLMRTSAFVDDRVAVIDERAWAFFCVSVGG